MFRCVVTPMLLLRSFLLLFQEQQASGILQNSCFENFRKLYSDSEIFV